MSTKREPTRSFYEKDSVVVRPLFPSEKDDFTVSYFHSLSKSYIGLPLTGIGTIVTALLGKELFSTLIDFCASSYLSVGAATIVAIEKGLFIVLVAGAVMLVIGLKNLFAKILE